MVQDRDKKDKSSDLSIMNYVSKCEKTLIKIKSL
jgi:hypothetical protein